MEKRGVLIGAIAFVFGSFLLMISLLLYESYKSKQMKALVSSITTEARPAPSSMPSLDYSMYKTKIGDEGRDMVQVPEGPFIMGSKDGDPDEVPERQVTIGDMSHPLPDPFLVLATQNPIEQEGTYPLPEAQVDRFLLKVRVDYPTIAEERMVLRRWMTTKSKGALR